MDDERLKELQQEIRMLAMFSAQSLAMIAAYDPVYRKAMDDMIAHFEGIADSTGAKTIMHIVRESADKMLAVARQLRPE